jgi:hypothetical protein
MLPTIDDLTPVAHRQFRDERGVLVPIELSRSVPFVVVRLFWVVDVPAGTARGAHAHKICHQYLICAAGSLHVEVFDGVADRTIALAAGQALHVPPAIYAAERFDTPRSLLMVLCDRPFEDEDYIMERDELVAYRQQLSGP